MTEQYYFNSIGHGKEEFDPPSVCSAIKYKHDKCVYFYYAYWFFVCIMQIVCDDICFQNSNDKNRRILFTFYILPAQRTTTNTINYTLSVRQIVGEIIWKTNFENALVQEYFSGGYRFSKDTAYVVEFIDTIGKNIRRIKIKVVNQIN